MESVAAIEKLIKKRIERVLVAGFQPNAGTVATLMSGEAKRGAEVRQLNRNEGPRNPGPRHEGPRHEGPRRDAGRREKPPADPIFSKPYEPGLGPAPEAQPAKPEAAQGKRKQPQLAALLGGLKRA
jgi:hypothetical protein